MWVFEPTSLENACQVVKIVYMLLYWLYPFFSMSIEDIPPKFIDTMMPDLQSHWWNNSICWLETRYISDYFWQIIELSTKFTMQILKFRIFFLKMPFTPSCRQIDFIYEGITFKMTDFYFRHNDLYPSILTLIVEKVWSILYSQIINAQCQLS